MEVEMTKSILVIDDEEAIRKSFLLALEDTGYRVDVAESGEKGVEMQKMRPYDLIFLDLKMPGMNGSETLRTLRQSDETTPVYLITAFYEEFFNQLKSVEEDALCFEVMRKPFGRDQIVLVSKSILEGPMVH